jgi:hypothetical protein
MEFIGSVMQFLIRWLFILSWRFFTGAHMSGRKHNDSTWWHDASKRYSRQRNKYTWWKKKSRMKRATWRHCIFWPVTLLILGFIWSTSSMLFILGIMSPGLFVIIRGRVRLVFYNPVVATGSDGIVRQHWALKTRYRKFIAKLFPPPDTRKRPGLATEAELLGEPRVADIPVNLERAVRAELAEELNGQPVLELKLLMEPDMDHN